MCKLLNNILKPQGPGCHTESQVERTPVYARPWPQPSLASLCLASVPLCPPLSFDLFPFSLLDFQLKTSIDGHQVIVLEETLSKMYHAL